MKFHFFCTTKHDVIRTGDGPSSWKQGIKNLEHAFLTEKLNNKKFTKQFGYGSKIKNK